MPPPQSPGHYVAYISLEYVFHTEITTAIKHRKSSCEKSYQIRDTHGWYYINTDRFLLDPMKEKIHYIHQNIHMCNIHTKSYICD